MSVSLERRVARLAGVFGPSPDRHSPLEVASLLGITPDPWQGEVLMDDWQRALLCCSRQAGKSLAASVLALTTAVSLPGSLTLIVAPGERQAGLMFRNVATLYRRLGTAVETEVDNRLSMELTNGSAIYALPGKEATVRGFSAVDLVIADEAARIEDAMYHAVSPMLAVSGGRLIGLSSPWGRRGWFWEAWSAGGPEWRRWHVPATAVPRIDPAWLAGERERLPAYVYAQEYGAEFLDAEDALFATDDIAAALSADVVPLFRDRIFA